VDESAAQSGCPIPQPGTKTETAFEEPPRLRLVRRQRAVVPGITGVHGAPFGPRRPAVPRPPRRLSLVCRV
jgi:hypothetical protein